MTIVVISMYETFSRSRIEHMFQFDTFVCLLADWMVYLFVFVSFVSFAFIRSFVRCSCFYVLFGPFIHAHANMLTAHWLLVNVEALVGLPIEYKHIQYLKSMYMILLKRTRRKRMQKGGGREWKKEMPKKRKENQNNLQIHGIIRCILQCLSQYCISTASNRSFVPNFVCLLELNSYYYYFTFIQIIDGR